MDKKDEPFENFDKYLCKEKNLNSDAVKHREQIFGICNDIPSPQKPFYNAFVKTEDEVEVKIEAYEEDMKDKDHEDQIDKKIETCEIATDKGHGVNTENFQGKLLEDVYEEYMDHTKSEKTLMDIRKCCTQGREKIFEDSSSNSTRFEKVHRQNQYFRDEESDRIEAAASQQRRNLKKSILTNHSRKSMGRKRKSEDNLKLMNEMDLNDEFLDDMEEDSERNESSIFSEDNDDDEYVAEDEETFEEYEDEVSETTHSWFDRPRADRNKFQFSGNTDVNIALRNNTSPIELFEAFLGSNILKLITNETNKFASKCIEEKRRSGKMRRKGRDLQWKETNEGEILTLLGLVMLQGIVLKPELLMYHSTNQLLLTPIFSKIMARDRFLILLKYLHFSDEERGNDPQYKFRNVMNKLISKFKENYVPEQNISIDESFLLWKGRIRWKRYIPFKRARFEIESFVLAEAETGYVWNMAVYCGKETEYPIDIPHVNENELTKPTKVVLHLAKPLLDKGYCIGMDNYYASPELYHILIAHKTDAVGTVTANTKYLSPKLNCTKLKKGETAAQYCGKIMQLKWRDKKIVNMLSTIYDDSMKYVTVSGKETTKPTVCISYKKHHITGVDLMDQILSAAIFSRKGVKTYYKKIFFRLVEICLQNAHCIYKRNGGTKTLLNFKLQLIEEIFEKYSKDVHCPRKCSLPSVGSCLSRLTGRHFPEISNKEDGADHQRIQRRCHYCALQKKAKRSIYRCDVCNIALCVTPCFKLYHTEEKLPQ